MWLLPTAVVAILEIMGKGNSTNHKKFGEISAQTAVSLDIVILFKMGIQVFSI